MADLKSLPHGEHAAVAADLKRRGFAALTGLVAPAQAASARKQFFDFLRAQAAFCGLPSGPDDGPWAWILFNDPRVRGKLYEFSQGLAECHRIAFDERVLSLCRGLGLKVPVLRNTTLRIDFPGDDRVLQPAHQDIRGIRSRNCLNFWAPLQEVDARTGGLTVYEASHLSGPMMPDVLNASGYQVIAPERLAKFSALTVTMKPGEALVFDPYLVHASTPNAGSAPRLTWVFRFDDGASIDWLVKGSFELSAFDIQARKAA